MKNNRQLIVHADIAVNLSPQDIDDIMCCALEGGISHWCCKVEVEGKYLGEYASEQISRNGALILHDREEDKVFRLTLEHFLRGFQLYLEQGCHVSVEDNSVDTGDIDAVDADCIVQLGLFGEVVYG